MDAHPVVHDEQPLHQAGRPLGDANVAVILLHGRGSTAQHILALADWFKRPDVAYLAPQAFGNSWYPFSFLVPLEHNEPYLTSALRVVGNLVRSIEEAGIPAEQIILGGFSQGACLASEFVARHARRYGGLFALSGGVIGPANTPRDYPGSLEGTPVFIGCSDEDPHIPLARVHESSDVFRRLGGNVTEKIYPGMGHTINDDEIAHVVAMIDALGS